MRDFRSPPALPSKSASPRQPAGKAAPAERPIKRAPASLQKGQIQRETQKLLDAQKEGEKAVNAMRREKGAESWSARADHEWAEDRALAALENGADFLRGSRMGERSFLRVALELGWARVAQDVFLRMTRAQARVALHADNEGDPGAWPFAFASMSMRADARDGEAIKIQLWELLLKERLVAPQASPRRAQPGQQGTPREKTPLQFALESGDVCACRWLMDNGADFALAGWGLAGEPMNAAQWAGEFGAQQTAAYAVAVLEGHGLNALVKSPAASEQAASPVDEPGIDRLTKALGRRL